MKLADDVFPSKFAVSLCRECELIPELQSYFCPVYEEIRQLIEFQQMSLVNSFEDCLIVYHPQELTEKQLINLKIIFKVTPTLMPGHIFQSAMKNIAVENYKSKPDMNYVISNLHLALNQLGKKAVA